MQASAPPSGEQLHAWATQVAAAMEYVHGLGLFHGDLTAANIIVAADGEGADGGTSIKVGGFAFRARARASPPGPNANAGVPAAGVDPRCQPALEHGRPAARGVTAPVPGVGDAEPPVDAQHTETDTALRSEQAADVWAFGAVLWEMARAVCPGEVGCAHGSDDPRPALGMSLPPKRTTTAGAESAPSHARDQDRPDYATDATSAAGPAGPAAMRARLMAACWAAEPARRPTFAQVSQQLALDKTDGDTDAEQLTTATAAATSTAAPAPSYPGEGDARAVHNDAEAGPGHCAVAVDSHLPQGGDCDSMCAHEDAAETAENTAAAAAADGAPPDTDTADNGAEVASAEDGDGGAGDEPPRKGTYLVGWRVAKGPDWRGRREGSTSVVGIPWFCEGDLPQIRKKLEGKPRGYYMVWDGTGTVSLARRSPALRTRACPCPCPCPYRAAEPLGPSALGASCCVRALAGAFGCAWPPTASATVLVSRAAL